ncbi:fructose-1,6-bisphosphate aldolase [Haloarcula sp. CBA1130]|uniref:class I fructose-bisphosphate aldolase n=1 Tax=unclassified Haloarcula TaxID=2624677 RepID=UPI00124839C2|nr:MULTISPECIES: fructose-1,6-bisphosphate aldolase [unclassified Haloarcula]KAA9396595.1 fructose-1,6-bisphosphate aldolase [Haloarcula sp. CBA1130]KAA9397436.1 fructose-1,6-bisphosphate aldolase [Haloarcula sp. CBA1129]
MSEYDLLDTNSGNAVVVALDHGIGMGAIDGFEDPKATLDSVLAGEPDGVLVGPYFAERFADTFAASSTDVLVTADFVSPSSRPGEDIGPWVQQQACDTDRLLACDPVGVKSVLAFGRQDSQPFERNVDYITEITKSLRGSGVPHIVETVIWGNEVPDRFETDTKYVANACRIGWELGADILKAPYTGDRDSFEPIVRNAPVPVMILGGPSSGSVQAMLDDVAGAMAAGARGIVTGRSVWQTDNPAAVVSALRRVIHDSDAPEAVWSA